MKRQLIAMGLLASLKAQRRKHQTFTKYKAIFWGCLTAIGLFIYSQITHQTPLHGMVFRPAIAQGSPSSVHSSVHSPAQAPCHHPTPTTLALEPTKTAPVPLYEGLSDYQYPISTQNSQAQRYFNQGLLLAYGFNHAEAARSFREAAWLDPNCALCYWGTALVLGPNINAGMEKEAVPQAWEALQTAIRLSQRATNPREKALIQALAKRYTSQPVEDRKPLDLAYVNAMRQVMRRYPADLDVATLFAEALMDTMPWDYWQPNGQPKSDAVEIFQTLEAVLKQNPNHPGANHFYIHAVEKEKPELGLPAADRLMTLFPNAGHLVHMPSHIYIRTGRYHDAVLSNQRGIKADDAYLAQTQAQGIYPLAYKPHNHHFLWYAVLMTGQSQIALEAAAQTAKVDPKLLGEGALAGALQHYSSIPLVTQVRFSRWDDILSAPAPAQPYQKGIWHYGRGMAFLGKGQAGRAAQELNQLQAIAAKPALKDLKIWGSNSTASILDVATQVLGGEMAAQAGRYERAIAHLKTAVNLEDKLVYTEPPDWYHPTRQVLAKILHQAGKAREAEQVYRADLKIYPENGWSLYGLAQSLQAQGKTAEAKSIQTRFQTAWKYADGPLTLEQL
jgi:tetratricopeptide (TPR) repeat protein